MDNQKRSKEELEAENAKLLEKLDEQEKNPQPTPSEEIPLAAEEKAPVEEAKEEVSNKEVAEEEKPESAEDKDYKEKFAASTREAQRLYKDNLEIGKAFEDANKIGVEEQELKTEYPDWDIMSDTEKRLSKDILVNKKKWKVIDQAQEKVRTKAQWSEKVDTYTDDPQVLIDNPDLEGKEAAFRTYASDATKVQPGTELKLAVSAFLYEQSKVVKPDNKGEMFPVSSKGPKDDIKLNDDKISLEQGEVLKQSNYMEYVKLLKAGKIAQE